jgi:phosphoglycerate dehydrogenase-like enzyme
LAIAQEHSVRAVLTRGAGRVSRELISACPSLAVVCRVGAGVDTIDLEAAQAAGIPVLFAPGRNAASTAEHTILLMLAITRRALELNGAVRAGKWHHRARYLGVELRGKQLGIVGLGAIGAQVAKRAVAFGMRVCYFSRRVSNDGSATAIDWLPFTELLQQADIVSLHVPLTPDTHGLMGVDEFAQMKPGAYLINTARGALVNKAALVATLDSGHLAGYAADVFDPQPPGADDLALLNRHNVLVTPHIGGITDTTWREVCDYCARNVLAMLRGEAPAQESVYRC